LLITIFSVSQDFVSGADNRCAAVILGLTRPAAVFLHVLIVFENSASRIPREISPRLPKLLHPRKERTRLGITEETVPKKHIAKAHDHFFRIAMSTSIILMAAECTR
jgi:hypothetical protein